MDARTWVASVRCRPRALSSPRAWQASSSSCNRRSSALPASRRERNSHSTEWSKPGSASSSPSRYFQSIRARTASAARRSGRFSRNCRMVTRASRHGGSPGWPSLGKRSAKSASAKMAPSSSRRLRRGLPLRKAALATRAVSSGTGWIRVGLSDTAGLRRVNLPQNTRPPRLSRLRQRYPYVFETSRIASITVAGSADVTAAVLWQVTVLYEKLRDGFDRLERHFDATNARLDDLDRLLVGW